MIMAPEKETTDWLVKGLILVLSSAALGFALTGISNMNDLSHSMDKRLELIEYQLGELKENKGADEKQDASLSKHWKILGFHRDQINAIRHKEGEEPISWPDLGP